MIKKYFYLLWQRYIEPLDPFNLQLKHAIKTCIAVGISAFIAFQILKMPEKNGIWFVLASVFVMQMYIGDSYRERFFTQLIGGLIAAVMLFVSAYLGQYFIFFFLLMLIATYITFYLTKYSLIFSKPALFILILASCSGYMFTTDITGSWHRLVNFLIGMACAIIIANILWPFRPYKLLAKNLAKISSDLSKYIQFAIDDAMRGNIHHLRRYELKHKTLQSIQTYRKLVTKYGTKKDQQVFKQQGRLFIQVVALNDLFNKPTTEYTLDILENITDEFDLFSSAIALAIKKPSKPILQKIHIQLNKLKKATAGKNDKTSIIYDLKCITYLLEELHGTLSTIASST